MADFDSTVASAGDCFASHQRLCPNRFFRGTTGTSAIPACASSGVRRSSDDREFAEDFPRQIPELATVIAARRRLYNRRPFTSARLRIAAGEMPSSDRQLIAAFATAQPVGLSPPDKCQFQYGQFAERLSCEIPNPRASAGSGMAAPEIASGDQSFLAAGALAMPANTAATGIGASMKNSQFAENPAGEIFC